MELVSIEYFLIMFARYILMLPIVIIPYKIYTLLYSLLQNSKQNYQHSMVSNSKYIIACYRWNWYIYGWSCRYQHASEINYL